MWGIRSVDQLTQIARGIYEEMGRGETGGIPAEPETDTTTDTEPDADIFGKLTPPSASVIAVARAAPEA